MTTFEVEDNEGTYSHRHREGWGDDDGDEVQSVHGDVPSRYIAEILRTKRGRQTRKFNLRGSISNIT